MDKTGRKTSAEIDEMVREEYSHIHFTNDDFQSWQSAINMPAQTLVENLFKFLQVNE